MSAAITVVCKPGSSRPGISIEDGVVQLHVRERAIEGAANEACIRALAVALGVPRSRVTLVAGARSRRKRFAIQGLDEPEVQSRLLPK